MNLENITIQEPAQKANCFLRTNFTQHAKAIV